MKDDLMNKIFALFGGEAKAQAKAQAKAEAQARAEAQAKAEAQAQAQVVLQDALRRVLDAAEKAALKGERSLPWDLPWEEYSRKNVRYMADGSCEYIPLNGGYIKEAVTSLLSSELKALGFKVGDNSISW